MAFTLDKLEAGFVASEDFRSLSEYPVHDSDTEKIAENAHITSDLSDNDNNNTESHTDHSPEVPVIQTFVTSWMPSPTLIEATRALIATSHDERILST